MPCSATVTVSGIELSDTRDLSTELVIQKNDVVYNDLRGSRKPFEITPAELEAVEVEDGVMLVLLLLLEAATILPSAPTNRRFPS